MNATLRTRAIAASHAAFDAYHRRFLEASLRLPEYDPACPADRQRIRDTAQQCLGIHEAWTPTIQAQPVRRQTCEGFTVHFLQATSWPGIPAAALLYQPDRPARTPTPFVLLGCGHGQGGKLTPMYQTMARHLARRGLAVLCPDNLGQGERLPLGHADCLGPFACGTSLQGLIVTETRAWLDWALRHLDIDPQRTAAIGNSGGGTLSLFLAALEPRLAAVACSGYPSTFEFVARKEKKHCHCNLLPGIVGRLEMHHLLACFAPRPLLIFQGTHDNLFPPDLFYLTARRVRRTYQQLDADHQFTAELTAGGHSWDPPRVHRVGEFLAQALQLPADRPAPQIRADEPLLELSDTCYARWPTDALDVDAMAVQLTGQRVDAKKQLWDIFPPRVDELDALANVAFRGDPRQVLAQFEAFLHR